MFVRCQPRALTGVTKACAGWRRLNRNPRARAAATRMYGPCMSWVWRECGVGVWRLRMAMENDRVKLVRLWRDELLAAVMGC